MANEKRLIDADALMNKAYWHGKIPTHGCLYPEGSEAVDVDDIENSPTVDAVEVVHGRWEEYSRMPGYLQCSKCHDAHIWFAWLKDGKWNYCPNCGAKMDGDGNG